VSFCETIVKGDATGCRRTLAQISEDFSAYRRPSQRGPLKAECPNLTLNFFLQILSVLSKDDSQLTVGPSDVFSLLPLSHFPRAKCVLGSTKTRSRDGEF